MSLKTLAMKAKIKKCITILVFVLKSCTCAVNLTHSNLECGQAARFDCKVDPLANVRWDRNGNLFLSCYIAGNCDAGYPAGYNFSIDTTSWISTMILNPFAYSTYQNHNFSCSDTTQVSSVNLDISVPLTELTMQEIQSGNKKELTATTNCVKTDVGFTWSCVSSENVAQTVADYCNVSSFTTSGSAVGCSSGSDCSGPGLETKSHVLLFEEYNGTDSQTIKLAVKATHGSTTITTVSNNIYKIRVIPGSTTTTATAITSTSTISTTAKTILAPPTITTSDLTAPSTREMTQPTTIEDNSDIYSTYSPFSTTQDRAVSGSNNSRLVLIVVSSSVGSCILIIGIALFVFWRKNSIDTRLNRKKKFPHDPYARSENIFAHGRSKPRETFINTYPRKFENNKTSMSRMYDYYSQGKVYDAREGHANNSPENRYDVYGIYRGHYNNDRRYEYSRTNGDRYSPQGGRVTTNPLYTEDKSRPFNMNNTDYVVKYNGSGQQLFGYSKRPYQTNVFY